MVDGPGTRHELGSGRNVTFPVLCDDQRAFEVRVEVTTSEAPERPPLTQISLAPPPGSATMESDDASPFGPRGRTFQRPPGFRVATRSWEPDSSSSSDHAAIASPPDVIASCGVPCAPSRSDPCDGPLGGRLATSIADSSS